MHTIPYFSNLLQLSSIIVFTRSVVWRQTQIHLSIMFHLLHNSVSCVTVSWCWVPSSVHHIQSCVHPVLQCRRCGRHPSPMSPSQRRRGRPSCLPSRASRTTTAMPLSTDPTVPAQSRLEHGFIVIQWKFVKPFHTCHSVCTALLAFAQRAPRHCAIFF